MTKVTVETIGGKKCTVVWHKESKLCDEWIRANSGGLLLVRKTVASPYVGYDHIATALPALPRNPTPDDARLLYRYMAEGIEAVYGYKDHTGEDCAISAATNLDSLEWIISKNYKISLKHTLMNGQPCDVAIDDSKGASDDQG